MPDKKTNNLRCLNCHILDKHQLKYSFGNFKLYICNNCSNGFIYPIPKDMGKYYPDNYWQLPGFLGNIKNFVYDFLQSRRPRWVKSYLNQGEILDIGAGEAIFGKKMTGYKVTSIDFPGSKIKNPAVLKVDFLKWQGGKKFDAVVFWQSLEHVPDPGKYLKKASTLLKKDGLIFIECPRFDSLESKLFGKHWYHLDPPRHLSHYALKGLAKILKLNGLVSVSKKNIISPEHAYAGFLASLLNSLGFNFMESYLKRSNNFFLLVFIIILSPLALISESILLLMGQSPVMLLIAKKTK